MGATTEQVRLVLRLNSCGEIDDMSRAICDDNIYLGIMVRMENTKK